MVLTVEQERAIPAAERPIYYKENEVGYLDISVYEAAKRRIKECLLSYDRCYVSYSGGKDSLVVLYLTRMVMDEMGWGDRPLDVVFRDEELIPEPVIDFILKLRDEPEKWTLHYLAVPMKSHYFIMGKHHPYVQWDPNRKWIRPKPPGAIEQIHPDNKPMDQHEMNALTNLALGWTGRIGVLNGVRAQESLTRFMSCIAVKNHQNYIARNTGGAMGTDFLKVIFDWSEDDVFRFFWETGIEYCTVYDTYMHAGAELRVATPVHDKAYSQLSKLRETYPRFYEQILSIWPEIDMQQRYWKDYDPLKAIDNYPKSWAGIMQYIDENIEDKTEADKARECVKNCRRFKENNKRLNRYTKVHYGYPLLYVFEMIVKGSFLRGIQTFKLERPAYDEYEKAAEEEARAATAR